MKTSNDPRECPAYTLTESAAYARVPLATVEQWIRGRRARASIGRKSAAGLIRPASTKPCLLSFSNLVELFVLADIRRVHGVPLQRVRSALRYVETSLEIDRPLVRAKFKTDGLDLFMDHLVVGPSRAALVNVSAGGQLAVREALEARLERIEWDEKGLAARLFPFVRSISADQPRTIVMDPLRGYGRPVIATTGIRTSIVAERYRAGESAHALAQDYNVNIEQIEDAVRCEFTAAA